MKITIGGVVYDYDTSFNINRGLEFSIKSASAAGNPNSRISALINDASVVRDVDELASEYVDILYKNVVAPGEGSEVSGHKLFGTRSKHSVEEDNLKRMSDSGISIVSCYERLYDLKLFLVYGIYNKSVYEQFKEELLGGGFKQSGLVKRDARGADENMSEGNDRPIPYEMDIESEKIFLVVDKNISQIIISMEDYDDLAQARSDFQYLQALIRLFCRRYKCYFLDTSYLRLCLNALKKKLESVPRSSGDIPKIIAKIRKDIIPAQSFEKAFLTAFSRIQACRTPTYYSYHDNSGGQGPHTIARVLSVRSNISFMKRCLADDRFLGANFTISNLDADALMSPERNTLKVSSLVSYVVFTISGLYGVGRHVSDGGGWTMISEAIVLQHYRFTVSHAAKNAKGTVAIVKKYVSDVNLVISEIMIVMLSICRGIFGGNTQDKNELLRSLRSDSLALSSIFAADEVERVRKGVNLFARFWESNWQKNNSDYDRRNIFQKAIALVTLIQILHDMHPCGSAATSAITDADLSGKGESTLYKNLVSDSYETKEKLNELMLDFLVKAVDLRFRKQGADFRLTSADQLLNMSLYDEYFPDALFAAHARNYVYSRVSAILKLTSLMPEVDSVVTALPRRNQLDFSRALSPDRFRRGK